jgi:hypothetical protein
MTTKEATGSVPGRYRPGDVTYSTRPGSFYVTGFATGIDEEENRRSYYLLERLDGR